MIDFKLMTSCFTIHRKILFRRTVMRIAIILLNKGRGSGEVARQHAKHLAAKGHKVYLMHPDADYELENVDVVDIQLHSRIYPVHEYLPAAGQNQKQVARMSFDEAISYVPDYEKALESVIQDVDIVISHHTNLNTIAAHRVARRHGKTFVVFIHGTGIEPRHFGFYDDKIWKLIEDAVVDADGILVTTEYVRDSLVRPLIDVPLDRFLVLPVGVELTEFHPENIQGIREKYGLPKRYVICPGALTRIKGPQNVAEASKYYHDLAQTIFIGAGELEDQLKQELDGRGRVLGFVPSEDKAKLINAATLLVAAPEKKEHFGIIYAEALAGGTPPVAYEGGGVDSIVTPDVGVLTDRDPKILGLKVRELLENPELLEKMSRSARRRAEQLFDYNKLIPKLETWLISLANRRSR